MIDHLEIPKIANLCERLPDGAHNQSTEAIYDEMLSDLSEGFDITLPTLYSDADRYACFHYDLHESIAFRVDD
eukprot:2279345-Pyramimonas_sp.AAC.1